MNSRDPGDCVSCGQCLPDCPVYALTRREEDSPRGKLAVLKWFPSFAGPADFPSGEVHFRCTLCGRCRETCPSRLDVPDMIRAHRNAIGALRPAAADAGGGPLRPGPGLRPRFRGGPSPWVTPAARSIPRSRNPYRVLFPRGPAAPPGEEAPERPRTARLLADPLTAVFAPRRLAAAVASLRDIGGKGEVRWARGPSAWQRFRSGDEEGLLRLAREALDGLAPGEPVTCSEPETAELLAAALAGAGEGPEGRRFRVGPGLPAVLPPVCPADDSPPAAAAPTGPGPAEGTGWLAARNAGGPFTLLPPPLPLEAEAWEHWNLRAGAGAPDGWVPAPPAWRVLRGEMLVGLDNALAGRMALNLREAAGRRGIRTLYCVSTRSALWLAMARAAGLPAVRLL